MKRIVGLVVAVMASVLAAAPAQAAPQIEFLNPSGYQTTLTLSDKTDTDAAYHLVAWVKQVPANPIVEFEVVSGGNTVTLSGTKVGSDTWSVFLSLAPYTDGTLTIRANLFSNLSQVATTEKTVTVNRQDVPLPATADTIEITHPPNGGTLRFHTPKGGSPVAVIDGLASADAQQVRAFISQSDPGDAPEWTQCGTTTLSSAGVRMRCTLPEDVKVGDVNAIAMLANNTPPPAAPNATADQTGDAHRVKGASAKVTVLEVTPSSVQATPDECQAFTVSATDEDNRPIADANIDVHAVGPDDQLRFGTASGTTSGYKAPDAAHLSSEGAINCSDKSVASQSQGDHNAPGQSDTKHIESTGGTNLNGVFVFALYSAVTGSSDVEVWGDTDDDDVRDGSEPLTGAVIGWGQPPPPPQPSLVMEPASTTATTGDCIRFSLATRLGNNPAPGANVDMHIFGPDPAVAFCNPGDGSFARFPDQGSHSLDGHPDGTRHQEGEANSSGAFVFGVTSTGAGGTQVIAWYDSADDDSLGGGEASDSGAIFWQEPPPDGARTIAMQSNRSKVRKGRAVRFNGVITAADDVCRANQSVKLKSKGKGQKRFKTIKTKTSREDGSFSIKVRPRKTKLYRAVAPTAGPCVKARSETTQVRIKT